MTVERNEDPHARNIREWLLALLRFAITREQSDHAIALAIADKLDGTGGHWWPVAPRFFTRTSDEVCAAMVTLGDGQESIVLRRHLERIDDARLRRAFQAAIALRETLEPDRPHETRSPAKSNGKSNGKSNDKRNDLWRGLPVRATRRA